MILQFKRQDKKFNSIKEEQIAIKHIIHYHLLH